MITEPGLYNMDCMVALKEYPDNYFDLAIVDPPYGDAVGVVQRNGEIRRTVRPIPRDGFHGKSYGGGVRHITSGLRKGQSPPDWWNMGGEVRKKIIAWDVAPDKSYFDELFRVSRNQIIWGGNYFDLPPTRCFLIWRKTNVPEKFSMAMCEYAWTSFASNAKVFRVGVQPIH